MEKKRVLPRPVKWALCILMHGMAVAAVLCACTVVQNMEIWNERYNGEIFYSIDPFDEAEQFEASGTFRSLLENDLNDLAVMTVIRKQLEGPDAVYDGGKIIDVSAYANRKNSNYVSTSTLMYKLEDLLKWYKYGFSYKSKVFYTLESAADYFLTAYSSVTDVYDYSLKYSDTEAVVAYEDSDIQSLLDLFDSYGIGYYLTYSDNGQFRLEVNFLESQFLSVYGDTLEQAAHSWEEYGMLCNNLINAVKDLGYNYSLYDNVKNYFEKENTNVRYHIQIHDGKELITYTNEDAGTGGGKEYYTGFGQYIIYEPENMIYETNTDIKQMELWEILSPYDYTMNDSVKIWFGIDTGYPAEDVYRQAATAFAGAKAIWIYIGFGVGAALGWLFLLIFLSVMTGREKAQDGTIVLALSWFDYVHSEVALALAAVLGIIFVFCGRLFLGDARTRNMGDEILANTAVCSVLVISILFLLFWFSLVRRIKKRTLLRNSICFIVGKWLWKKGGRVYEKIKGAATVFYDNRSTAFRTLLPVCLFIPLNMLLGYGVYMTVYYRYYYVYLFVGMFCCLPLIVIDIVGMALLLRNNLFRKRVVDGIHRIREGDMNYQVDTAGLHGENLSLATAVNSIGAGIKKAVETSMKDERMKADLITNVSHDIKTPLTSIINYVDLLKREQIETEPVKGYIEVLDVKSQRLKQLTDDLVEASKISSGNIVLNLEDINLTELLKQSVGEFSEKLEQKNITVMESYVEGPHMITADSRRMWRIIENLFNNIFKYALSGTRVYIDIVRINYMGIPNIMLSIKNISAQQLNIRPEELTERFIRGDESRTTEGSGLGLSIAKSLTEIQHGQFNIVLDGDLFKVILLFPEVASGDRRQISISENISIEQNLSN